ncbi:MAG: amidoligase family protein [Eubacterium coprostanoligenes]|nr:amidoligase family protein [Eubacterium coprostanoligenes]
MFNTKLGIEIEFTGITRNAAAKVVANHLNGTIENANDYYDKKIITAPDGRKWTVMYDSSIRAQKKENGVRVAAQDIYKCELVSPILTYNNDIECLQEMVRKLRKAGAFVSEGTCGIHIHLDGADHSVRTLRNFINIIYSKNDLLYKALKINPDRRRWCKKMDESLVKQIKSKRPQTFEQLERIWYGDRYSNRFQHYNDTRYHFLNLHSFFNGNHTVELRGFNSTLHAGEIRSYIVLALALNNQALTQSKASSKKPQVENEKFAMRTYLNRIGLIGDEFKNCRMHLCKHLDGCSAWRFDQAA